MQRRKRKAFAVLFLVVILGSAAYAAEPEPPSVEIPIVDPVEDASTPEPPPVPDAPEPTAAPDPPPVSEAPDPTTAPVPTIPAVLPTVVPAPAESLVPTLEPSSPVESEVPDSGIILPVDPIEPPEGSAEVVELLISINTYLTYLFMFGAFFVVVSMGKLVYSFFNIFF